MLDFRRIVFPVGRHSPDVAAEQAIQKYLEVNFNSKVKHALTKALKKGVAQKVRQCFCESL